MDDEFWRAQYEARKQLANEKFQEGRQEGLQEGEQKGRQDTLNNLVAKGILTKEQVKNLKADFS